jgi:AraC-like DNA-binding protein
MYQHEDDQGRSEAIVIRSLGNMLEALRTQIVKSEDSRRVDDGWRRTVVSGAGFRYDYDAEIAKGGWEFYELGRGLCLAIVDMVTSTAFPRRHGSPDYLVLSTVLEGGLRINDPCGEQGELADGYCTIYGMPAGSEFETVCPPGKTVKWVSVFIERSRFLEATGLVEQDLPTRVRDFLNGSTLPYHNVLLSRAASLAARQILECPFRDTFRSAFLTAKALELTCIILHTLSNEQVEDAVGGVGFSEQDHRKLQRAIGYLKNGLEEPPNVDELASLVGLSRQKLQFGFRSVCGDTVARIRDKMRMERALNMLRTTSVPVIDVALETGYEHPGSFSRAFKASYGVSPARMRRMAQESKLIKELKTTTG